MQTFYTNAPRSYDWKATQTGTARFNLIPGEWRRVAIEDDDQIEQVKEYNSGTYTVWGGTQFAEFGGVDTTLEEVWSKPASTGEPAKSRCNAAMIAELVASFPVFNRDDICAAHYVLEIDYNVNGMLWERPSNRRRMASTDCQLANMNLGHHDLPFTFDELTTNAQAIYRALEARYGFTNGSNCDV